MSTLTARVTSRVASWLASWLTAWIAAWLAAAAALCMPQLWRCLGLRLRRTVRQGVVYHTHAAQPSHSPSP